MIPAAAAPDIPTRAPAVDPEPFRNLRRLPGEPAGAPAAAPDRMLSVTALPGTRPGRVVVEVVGEVDSSTAPLLDACLHSQATRPGTRDLVVDLRKASFRGGAGARAVARAGRLCRRRGARLSVCRGTVPERSAS